MNSMLNVHFISCLICGIVSFIVNKSLQNALAIFFGTLFFPIGGAIVVVFYYISKIFKSNKSIDKSSLMKQEDGLYKFYQDLILSDEMNVLPINDVLIISEDVIKRERFLATIKKDISKYTKFIKLALDNKDSETSHYAAAIIQETKRKMDVKAQVLSKIYDNDEANIEFMILYADFLIPYLEIDLFDERNKKRYIYEYINIAQKMVNQEYYIEKYMIALINYLLILEEYEKAIGFGDIFMDKYPETTTKYLLNMKIKYMCKDIYGLKQIVDKLRQSDIVFDNDTMNQVRFWIGETI